MDITEFINGLWYLLASVLGGIVVALVNHFLTRKKTEAEIRNIDAQTKKIMQSIEGVSYELAQTKETILYDVLQDYANNDFEGNEGRFWSDGKYIGNKGLGTLKIENGGIINLQRKNTDGRYEVRIQRYSFNGKDRKYIPKNEVIAGKRKLRLECQAKIIGGSHTLRFVIKDNNTQQWITNEQVRITEDNWTPISLYFQISPAVDFYVRIDDEQLSKAPSSVQIRNLRITER